MIKVLRTFSYSLLVIGALGYTTSLVYFSPGQIEKRASGVLGNYLAATPTVTGARQSWMHPLAIDRIEIPALPVIDQRTLLILENLEVERAGSEDWSLGKSGGGLDIRIRKASLFLDRELVPGSPSSLSSVPIWNFQDLLQKGALFQEAVRELIRRGHRITVDQLVVELQEIRRRQDRASWTAGIDDLTISGASALDLEIRGDVQRSSKSFWSDGQFQIHYRLEPRENKPSLEVRGSLDNIKGLDEWLSLLAPAQRRIVSILKPSGPVTFLLTYLRFYPERKGPHGAEPAKMDYLATLRHYDSTFQVFPWNLEIKHVNGAITLDPAGFSFGPSAPGGTQLSGEIWGSEVELRGKVQESGAEFTIRIPETDLKTVAVSAQPDELSRIWRRFRPSGRISGEFTSRFDANFTPEWEAAFAFQNLIFSDLSLVGPSSGKLTLKGPGEKGQGLLTITSGHLEPLGEVQGEVPLEWTDRRLTLRLADLFLGEGNLSGEIRVPLSGGPFEGNLRFDHSGLDFSEGLFTASRVGGRFTFTPIEGNTCGQGKIDLEGVALALRMLPQNELFKGESMEFAVGQLLLNIGPDAVDPVELILREQQRGMRLWGSIGYRGDLDAVAVLAEGEAGRKLNRLAPESAPGECRQAVGKDALLLRLSGSALNPRIRRVEWSDPKFQKKPAPSPSTTKKNE